MADQSPSPPAALTVESVGVAYGSGSRAVQVLADVDLAITPGRLTGLVGESGCGKTTLGRVCVGLVRPNSGSVRLPGGIDLARMSGRELRQIRPRLQMIFQNPYTAFNPQLSVERSMTLNLRRWARGDSRKQQTARIMEACERVRLNPAVLTRRPADLSGGQLQRAAIARALLVEPSILVADEIMSAIDLATQDEVMETLLGIVDESGLAVLFISHNLALVASSCEYVAVMEHGRIAESGETKSVLRDPQTAITRELISCVPRLPPHSSR